MVGDRSMRKGSKRTTLVGVGGLSAIATGAAAAILISAQMTGSLTTIAKPALTYDSSPPEVVSTDGSGIVCKPTMTGGKLNVEITNAMAGSSCVVRVKADYSAVGSTNAKLQSVTMTGLDAKFTTGGIPCGQMLNTSSNPIAIELTVPSNAGVVSQKPLTGAITAVPSAQYDPALCT